ncbi:G patch domain-containing protein 1, partial [Lecanoromycetidae sp. Uapishka_2]
MASKRSRATFEADLQAQQSPYVTYGTPLPPLDPDTRDDGSYVPVWKQEVTDEQGRKRLHGAFTGGFSAGYFNTVGSKEGWAPSTFVSSRSNRIKEAIPSQQRPEDFMDDEDLAEAEEARTLQTTDTFAGFGSTAEERTQHESFMDVFKVTGETMGVKLLKKMGWREGQGVGPKVRRKARLDEDRDMDSESGLQTHLFAPENSSMISFTRKNDRKGLGFEGEGKLSEIDSMARGSKLGVVGDGEEDAAFGALTTGNKVKKKKYESKGAFGVGILNDNGSDDEDPYHIGPQISYNRIIGGDKNRKKKADVMRPSANPLLSNKPVFISKKASAVKGGSTFRRCHDGRLPLNGFILSSNSDPLASILSQDGKFPPPTIPQDWKSSKTPANATTSTLSQPSYQSPAAIAAASKLSPKSRAALLGELPLPGKSVFDFLTPGARDRIATATNNSNLPPALSEASAHSSSSHTRTLKSLVPQLSPEVARIALGRGTAGWMPYAEDPAKRTRYRTFLEIRAGYRPESALPDRDPGATNDDWAKEMNEFAHAAQIFKPMTGMMATRFTTSSSVPQLASDNVKLDGVDDSTERPQLLQKPAEKVRTPAEEAAAVGMYGPLTRSVENFYPSRLLCKRFNIKPPAHVQVEPGEAPPTFDVGEPEGAGRMPPTHSTALPQKRLELIGESDMKQLRISGGGMRPLEMNTGIKGEDHDNGVLNKEQRIEETLIDPEWNEALEKERPGEAVFKAIFGSDSEDD